MKVISLHEYPVKGMRGNDVSCSQVSPRGLGKDRRWMIIDENNQFLTQRSHAGLALLSVKYGDQLVISNEQTGETVTARLDHSSTVLSAKIWNSICNVHHVSSTIDGFLSKLLMRQVQLVYMDNEELRPIDPQYAADDEIVSFADGYPILLTSLSSLAELNSRLTVPVSIDRFRSNIVIDGQAPFIEEEWKFVSIGEVRLRVAKPSGRCKVININQQTGESNPQTLKTLSELRRTPGHADFGINLIPESMGLVHIGDPVRPD